MADTTTTLLGLTKPDIGGSDDSWGTKSNNNLDLLDSIIGKFSFQKVTSIAGLQAAATTDANSAARSLFLDLGGRSGVFTWKTGDYTAEVTADTQQGIYIASSSDPTGAAGCWVRVFEGAVYPEWFGAAADGSTDDTSVIDAIADFFWDSVPEFFTLALPERIRIDKAGDILMPPNVELTSQSRTTIVLGNQLTRLAFKRDNTRVGAEYQTDSGYWGLGPNKMSKIKFALASGVTSNDCPILVSDLISFQGREIESNVSAVGINFENDAKWTEFIDLEGKFRGTTAGIRFTRTGTSTYSSFGHSIFDVNASASDDGESAVLIEDGASVYNSKWRGRGFCAASTGGQEAYVFKLIDSGSDLNYSSINWTIENLNNNGTAYGIHASGGAGLSYVTGNFHGIGQDTKFFGVNYGNNITVVGGAMLDDAGSSVFQGNQIFKIVTGVADTNGDNLLRFAQEKAIALNLPGTMAANDILALLPIPHNRMRIASVQFRAGVASSGNTGAVWNIGIRKGGSTNPTTAVQIPDGTTQFYSDIFYDIPEAWLAVSQNNLVARSTTGSGNDGTGPQDVLLTIKYYEL